MALLGSAAMIVVAAVLVVWTIVFYQSAVRSPILTFSGRRHENLCRLLDAYRQRLLALSSDPQFAALDTSSRQAVLGKILLNLSKQYYRTAGWANYRPEQLLATDWPELASLISAISHPRQIPGQTSSQVSAQVPNDAAALTTALSQISYRAQLHAQSLTTRQDLVIKPPRRSRFWIVPITLIVLCLLVVSGLQTRSWAVEQQAVRADRVGDLSLAEDLRLRQANSWVSADRWLINYNLGTTYLNAGELQKADKYLSRAKKKMPFVLETKMTEPQAVLAGCQVNYNLAVVILHINKESNSKEALVSAGKMLVYCNQAALKTRQKYWKIEHIAPGSSKVNTSLNRVTKDTDALMAQILKQAGSDFHLPAADWLEDFGS